MYKILLLFSLWVFSACATHAPMSEMVMFNKATIPDSVEFVRSGTVTYFYPGITSPDFEGHKEGEYASYSDGEFPSFTIHTLKLKNDGSARSLSFGRGLGIDWTKNIKQSYFGTLALSIPYSTKFTVSKVFLNKRWAGLSGGVFTGLDSRRYNRICNEDESCRLWPDRTALLFNSGLRTRYLIRSPRSPGLSITGSLEIGYIWNTSSSFLGFNVSITSLE